MKKRPAFLAGPALALAAAVALGACTPASKVAEPDIVMKSAVIPQVLTPCLAYKLGQQFRDHRPSVDYYRGVHEISIDSPRGEKLAFVTVESDHAGGSVVSFWNGDLYWPNHITSGVWPDVMRDNWHRFETAENACQPVPVAAKPIAAKPVAAKPKPRPAQVAAPAKAIGKAKPLKPLLKPTAPAATSGAPRKLVP
ncbi:MAG TPA: hypothetical protein VFK91_03845 [Methyloceanibacter sp.]|nr:hypothetical protein [Methyloceanibacter sp.]